MRSFLATVMALAALAAAGGEEAIATVDYAEGPVSVTRDGAALSNPGIGDAIDDGDLIATGAGATLNLKLEKATGMSGSVKVSPNTSFYFSVDSVKGERQSLAELITGQVGLKVKKISGAPGFSVSAGSAVCAVRGTEFDVVSSPSGSLLVDCSEGEVECSSEGASASAVPGQAVEKLEDAKLARRAVALADYENFKARWIAGEAEAFKKNAPRAARRIALRYFDLAERLAANHERIAASGALRAWLQEERSGSPPAMSDEELDRRLAELGPLLADSRATMERERSKGGEQGDTAG